MNEDIAQEFDPALAAEEGTRRPFKAYLDVGLHRTTTGARLFAAVKGACDGGVSVPHETTRFVGTSKDEEGNVTTDFEVVRKYIFAGHIADYMNYLQENDEEAYKRQFSQAVKHGVTADQLEGIYAKIHEAIRAETKESFEAQKRDPSFLGYFKTRSAPRKEALEQWKANSRAGQYYNTKKGKLVNFDRPLGVQARKAKLLEKLNAWVMKVQAQAEAAAAEAASDSEEEESGSDDE